MANKRERRRPTSAADLARRAPSRTILKRFLIACEGSKTEPKYFEDLVKDMQLTTADVRICGKECDSDPLSVVRFAIETFKSDGDYDHVYCVIDKDSHTNLPEALNLVRQTKMSGKKTFESVVSVPCFEYWVLLHYEFSTAPHERTQRKSPCDSVIDRVKAKRDGNYTKGSPGLYQSLLPNMGTAMDRAAKSLEAAKANQTDNPSTGIHLLIQALKTAVEEANPAKLPSKTGSETEASAEAAHS